VIRIEMARKAIFGIDIRIRCILDNRVMKNINDLAPPCPPRNMDAVILFCLTFIYCLGPVLNSYSSIVDFIFFSSIILSLYLVFRIKRFPPPFINIFWILVPIFFYITVSAVFYNEAQVFDFIRLGFKPIRIVATVIGGFALVALFLRSGYSLDSVYLFIFLSISFHSVIMILQLYFPDFKDLIYSYTTSSSLNFEDYSYEYNFRMGGLAGSYGSSTLSVTQAFGVILLPFLNNGRVLWQRWVLNLCAGIVLFSVIICGRSGLLFMLIFYPLSVILASGSFSGRIAFKFMITILALLVFMSGLLALISNLDNTSDLFYSLRRTFDSLIMIKDGGKWEDNTVNTLLTFWILPSRPEIFILGSSEFLINTHFSRTLDSDIGYIRNIWGMGIFVALVYWMPYFYFCIKGWKNLSHYKSANVLLIITLITILLHAKEDVFYSRILLSYFALILGVFYFEKFPRNHYVRN